MKRAGRTKIGLECNECGARNYSASKGRNSMPGKLVLKKFCPPCGRHTQHREGK